MRVRLLMPLLLLLGWGGSSCTAVRPPPRRVDVLCHYMTWFQWRSLNGQDQEAHWSWNGPGPRHDPSQVTGTHLRDIGSVAYPRIGVYDSADPDVVDYHLLTAKAAGIQGFVVDWYGPGNEVDTALQVLCERAEALDFKVAICLEEKLCFPGWQEPISDRAAARAAAVALLADLAQRYAHRPCYWRHGGRPGVFIFNSWGDWPGQGRKTFDGAEWQQIAAAAQASDLTLIPQHFALQGGFVRAAFGWCGGPEHLQYVEKTGNARLADGSFDFYVAPACPGFDDRGVWGWGNGPRLDAFLGTETYAQYWRFVRQSRADTVQIVTWNDFGEGTVIEPTVQWGHLFIDETERQVDALTGRPANVDDNRLPYRWYVARKFGPATVQPQVAQAHQALAAGEGERAARLLAACGVPTPDYLDARREPARFQLDTPTGRERQALLAALDRRLMQGVSAQASSQEDESRGAALAADGRLDTRWASAARDDQWLLLTWPQPVQARQLGLAWEAAFARSYEVQVSGDGQTWQSVAAIDTGSGGVVRLGLPPQPFRQLRLNCRQRGTVWGFSIYEIGLIP